MGVSFLKFLGHAFTFTLDLLTRQSSRPFQHARERNHKAFRFINTFKQRQNICNHWLTQYCHKLHRVINTCGNAEKFLCVRHIYLTSKVPVVKRRECYIWNTSTRKVILSSRVITAFIRTALKQLFHYCDWEEFHLILHRCQTFTSSTTQLVSCVITLL